MAPREHQSRRDLKPGEMSPRTSAWLAWSVWALSLAFASASVPLYWSTSPSAVLLGVPQIVAVFPLAVLVLAFSIVYVRIARPDRVRAP